MSIQWLEAVATAFRRFSLPWMLFLPILVQCIVQIPVASGENHDPQYSFKETAQERFKRQSWGTQDLWKDLGLPQFWNQFKDGPYGVVIRGWQYAKCGKVVLEMIKFEINN